MSPDEYCLDIVKKSGSSFVGTFYFLPAPQKRAMRAIYAFCTTVDDIADLCSEKEVALKKLHWWLQEIDRLFRAMPQHPITKALQPFISQYGLEQKWFEGLIEGMLYDVHEVTIDSLEDLERYCYHVAGIVGLMTASVLGATQPSTFEFAKAFGTAFQWVNMIRDIGEDAREGRIYFPKSRYELFSVTKEMILAGKNTPELSAYLSYEAKTARQYYKHAFTLLPDIDRPNQRVSLAMGGIYFTLLDELERSDFCVMDRKISLPLVRKCLIAWKVIRQEKRHSARKSRSLVAGGQDSL